MTRAIRGLGWVLLVSGVVVLLYVVYLLWFTNLSADRAQQDLAERWERNVGTAQLDDEGEGESDQQPPPDDEDAEDETPERPVEAVAVLWFERDGEPVVAEEPLYVVDDVTLDALRAGPGHYPDSAEPGEEGNLAIAGHRTTYGAPFWSLEELQDGDTIHVLDRDGEEWVYEYREQRVVSPGDTWVVGEDPLETDTSTITLTTCHPRFSAAQRLIAWGERVEA